MSLPHWIKWNKVKGKYVINNDMECFEQKIRITKKDYRITGNILKEWLEEEDEQGEKINAGVDKNLNGRITILSEYFLDKGME